MKRFIKTMLILMVSLILVQTAFAQTNSQSIETSRSNCVKIVLPDLNSSGTGFFLDSTHIVTCFHVIAEIEIVDQNKGDVRFTIANNINVVLSDGETILAKCISVPTQQDASPLENDFAILKLDKKPEVSPTGLPLHKGKAPIDVGSDILFSGYPFGVLAMITHKGIISGMTQDQSVICIQAPINKGISGGALLNDKSEVIGIISNREGGVLQGLDKVTKQITELEQGQSGVQMTIKIGGVNTLGVTKELILTLDRYISTGMGYARSIKGIHDYLERNPNLRLNEDREALISRSNRPNIHCTRREKCVAWFWCLEVK